MIHWLTWHGADHWHIRPALRSARVLCGARAAESKRATKATGAFIPLQPDSLMCATCWRIYGGRPTDPQEAA